MEERVYLYAGELRSAGGTSIVGTIAYNRLSKKIRGEFKERILPGAFADAVKNPELKMLWQHDSSMPLASTAGGTLRLVDSPKMLTVIAHLNPEISYQRDALEAVKRKDAAGLSFGFHVPVGSETWATDTDGGRIRELRKIDAHEFSVVTFPAYPDSSATVRTSITTRRRKSMNLNEKRQELGRIFNRIRELEGKDNLDAIEDNELRRLDSEYDQIEAEIKKEDMRLKNRIREIELSQSQREPNKPMPQHFRGEDYSSDSREAPKNPEERREGEILTRAISGLSVDGGSGDGGGNLVLSTVMGKIITKAKVNAPIFSLCDVMKVEKAASISLPSLESDPADPTWTAELSIGAADNAMDIGGRALYPKPLAQYVKISKKLIEIANEDVIALVEDRLAYKFSLVIENAILNGSGSNQPLGVFTNHKMGLGTDRDVSTGNTATQIKADNLIEMQFTLKAGYAANKSCAFAFHRNGIKQIRQLKDGEGNYLFQPSLTAGTPSMLLGIPVYVSEYVPSTFTSGKYVGILGDWSYYKIGIAKNTSFEVLKELFALSNQYAVTARAELDGMPAVSEAFVRCKLG